MYSILFIWVEGPDDKRFFDKIIESGFKKQYDKIVVRPYRNLPKETLKKNFKNARKTSADYIFVSDKDHCPCITERKEKVKNKYKYLRLGLKKIQIVQFEIESWYYAGLNASRCEQLQIDNLTETNNLTKEEFNRLYENSFGSRIDFMIEILKHFDIKTAMKKNKSFEYFVNKYLQES